MLAVNALPRIDGKKRAVLDHRKRQFAHATWEEQAFEHRMNFYSIPPTGDISLEEFEEWGIARLKVLTELEACQFRNCSLQETEDYMRPVLQRYMPLESTRAKSSEQTIHRKKDHYSHWTLRLAFSSTTDLRQRFARLETQLFKLRLAQDDVRERQAFIDSLPMSWQAVVEEEKGALMDDLRAATGVYRGDEESWFKVDWELVPDLVERRQVLLRKGKAYLHTREQTTLVVSQFSRHLETGLELASRFLPRMDEDNRLKPILHHLSQSFNAPDAGYTENTSISSATQITASSIDNLSTLYPLCMRNLQRDLRQNNHLKHFGRLQYTLFLKGIGLNLNECVLFWRKSFKLITDDKFKSEYLYNIRHAYGDVGGDANRRGRGYTPYSCQKLLTEPLPSAGQSHGCPYRTYAADNLVALLQSFGISDTELLRNVREDISKQRYHIACNRVFETTHRNEIKKVKDQSLWPAGELDTILHPNTYFKRSFLLKNLGKAQRGELGVDPPTQQ